MKFIGITGGVGAGKSEILNYLQQQDGVRVMLADEIAHDLMEPGTACYREILRQFGLAQKPKTDTMSSVRVTDDSDLSECGLLQPDGRFDRAVMARVIFSDDTRREKLNAIVHPAVKEYVLQECERERAAGQLSFLFLEAALLVEEGYSAICDELWYIHTDEQVRRQRLKASRGYSDARIDGILASQLTDAQYYAACTVVIDNNGDFSDTIRQIQTHLTEETQI